MRHITAGLLALVLTVPVVGLAAPGGHASGRHRHPSPPAKSTKTVEVRYKAHCGMIYSAADAKKYHYVCPMDHKPLTKIVVKKSAPKK